jgi:transcriptional regulator with XRE-family HTH domain
MPDMPIGALVHLYRVKRKMGTTSLATHAGITVRYLEMIEADSKTPSVPVLRKLAKVLGCALRPCWVKHRARITRGR